MHSAARKRERLTNEPKAAGKASSVPSFCIRVSTPLPAAYRELSKADSFAARDQAPKKVEGTGVGTSMQEARLFAGSTNVPRRPFRHEPGLFTAPKTKVAQGLRRASALRPWLSHGATRYFPSTRQPAEQRILSVGPGIPAAPLAMFSLCSILMA